MKKIFIAGICIILVLVGITIYFVSKVEPLEYPNFDYTNYTNRYFENTLLDKQKLVKDIDETLHTKQYKFYETTDLQNYNINASLAINSFFQIFIIAVDNKVEADTNSIIVTNGFKIKIVFNTLSSSIPNEHAEFYGLLKQYLDSGNIYLEYRSKSTEAYKKIVSLKECLIYDENEIDDPTYENDLSFVNAIKTKGQKFFIIENQGSNDKLFNADGDYRIWIEHSSRWISDKSEKTDFFEKQIIPITISKKQSELKNLLIPASHTINELFYSLYISGAKNYNSFITYDFNSPEQILIDDQLSILFDANEFLTRTHEDLPYSYFLINPEEIKLSIIFQQNETASPQTIYTKTNFVEVNNEYAFKNIADGKNYFQPAKKTENFTSLLTFNSKGIYAIKIEYSVRAVSYGSMNPVSEVQKCDDVYLFELV